MSKSAFKCLTLIVSIIAFIVGILVVSVPFGANIIINYIFVVMLGIMGIAKICQFASFKDHSAWDLVLGILYLLVCILLLATDTIAMEATIGYVLAVIAIVGGIGRFFAAHDVRKINKHAPISWFIVSGILLILLGICLICLPIFTQIIYTYLIGIFLIAYGIVAFISGLCISTKK